MTAIMSAEKGKKKNVENKKLYPSPLLVRSTLFI